MTTGEAIKSEATEIPPGIEFKQQAGAPTKAQHSTPHPQIRAVFILSGTGGIGPACEYTLRAKDGWSFVGDHRTGITAIRTIKAGLPSSSPFQQMYGIGVNAIRYVDYDAQ